MTLLYKEERVPLVIRLLEERPLCERCSQKYFAERDIVKVAETYYAVKFENAQRSTVIHEKKLRSAGGSITNEDNCVALCQECHREVHAKPAQARKDGWIIGRFE